MVVYTGSKDQRLKIREERLGLGWGNSEFTDEWTFRHQTTERDQSLEEKEVASEDDNEIAHDQLQPTTSPVTKEGFDILITSYEIFLKDWKSLVQLRWALLVVDEAQRLKSSESLLYTVLMKLFNAQNSESAKASVRILLTGTPLQNNTKVSI